MINGKNVKDRLAWCGLGFLCCAAVPAVVAAQDAPQTSAVVSAQNAPQTSEDFEPGRVMIGLVYDVAGVFVQQTSPSEGDVQRNLQLGGLGYVDWPRLSLAVRVTDHLLVGLEGGARWSHETIEDDTFNVTFKQRNLTIEPYAAWLFLHGRTRPYVRLAAGYWGDSFRYTDDSSSTTSRSETHGLSVSAGAGLHYFLGEHFSLGAGLEAGYIFSQGENATLGEVDWREGETNHGFQGLLNLNLAAWI